VIHIINPITATAVIRQKPLVVRDLLRAKIQVKRRGQRNGCPTSPVRQEQQNGGKRPGHGGKSSKKNTPSCTPAACGFGRQAVKGVVRYGSFCPRTQLPVIIQRIHT